METSLHYNLQQKQLGLTVLEKITTDPKLELRAKGLLNTVTGNFVYRGTLKKYIELDKGRYPALVGAGLCVSSDTNDEPAFTLSAKKVWTPLKEDRHKITAKATIDRDFKQQKLWAYGGLRVSHTIMNLTSRQDARVKLGVDIRGNQTGQFKPKMYFQVRENNWALRLRDDKWSLTYDL